MQHEQSVTLLEPATVAQGPPGILSRCPSTLSSWWCSKQAYRVRPDPCTCHNIAALQSVCPVHLDRVTQESMLMAPDPLNLLAWGAMTHDVSGQVAAGSTVVRANPHHRHTSTAVAMYWHALQTVLSLEAANATCSARLRCSQGWGLVACMGSCAAHQLTVQQLGLLFTGHCLARVQCALCKGRGGF